MKPVTFSKIVIGPPKAIFFERLWGRVEPRYMCIKGRNDTTQPSGHNFASIDVLRSDCHPSVYLSSEIWPTKNEIHSQKSTSTTRVDFNVWRSLAISGRNEHLPHWLLLEELNRGLLVCWYIWCLKKWKNKDYYWKEGKTGVETGALEFKLHI